MATHTRPATKPHAAGPPDAPAAPPAERVSTTAPKPRRDVGLAWLVLLGLAVLAAVPLVIDLGSAAAWTRAESLSIAISTETHQRKTPVTDPQTSLEEWTPVYEGASRWDLPPGGVWLHQFMFTGIQPTAGTSDAPPQDRAYLARARAGSVLMALLFVAAVYWSGHSIGGVTTGALSAMVAMTMPLVIGFGRHATTDMAAIAWSTLSIAGALWAMRPLRAAPSLPRQLVGWLVCGAGLGLAALTAGPRAVPTTILCTVLLAMLCPRRIGHIMGLLASTAVAALLVTPWALHVHDHNADVWQMWINQLTPELMDQSAIDTLRRAGWRLSLAGTIGGLWLVWLIPALTQPFSTSTGKARRKMMLGWAWLAAALLLIAFAPGRTKLATLLIAVAPASVATGLVIQQFHDLSSEGRHARLWLVCRWIAAGLMLLLAVALPLVGYLLNHRPDAVAWLPMPERPLLATMHWSYYAAAGLALLLAAVLSIRFAIGHHPGRTAACLALWMLAAYTLAAVPLSRGPAMNAPAEPPQLSRPHALR